MSQGTAGAGDQASTEPVISGNGDVIAFTSAATNLVFDGGSAQQHVFLRTVSADHLIRLSPLNPAVGNQFVRARISADGARDATVVDLQNACAGASPVQLVVESAVYRSASGVTRASGSNALAIPVP